MSAVSTDKLIGACCESELAFHVPLNEYRAIRGIPAHLDSVWVSLVGDFSDPAAAQDAISLDECPNAIYLIFDDKGKQIAYA